MYLSVIISTYNQPQWLEKVLYGYLQQTYKDFEVVIADDGSNKETFDLIERIKSFAFYPIKHVWHPDEGFRKCTILNKAIIASTGTYLVFTDGDCVPRSDFLQRHVNFHEPGFFLSGGMYRLNIDVSHKITIDDIQSQRCFSLSYLRELGQRRRFLKDLKLSLKKPKIIAIMNSTTPTIASWNGHNASGWKTDLLEVGGFDERMKYGGEDRELGERLFNNGIKSKQIRYSAICLHLEHKRGYVTKEDWINNFKIRRETRKERKKFTPFGIQRPIDTTDSSME